MKGSRIWLERRKASLCLFLALCTISLCVIIVSGRNAGKDKADAYTVTIRHYGLDAAEMERSVTIPLEDALFEIPGVIKVQSSSENSMSKVFVHFRRNVRGHYNALRDAAQRVYESLPQSAQRPQIQSTDSWRIPVWSAVAAVDEGFDGFYLEKVLKPRLESLEGAGEVLVSGTSLREITITLDHEKAAALSLSPSAVAAILAMNDGLFSGGLMIQGGREIIVTVDGRAGSEETGDILPLGSMPIPLGGGRMVVLSDIASIAEHERRPDSFSRINGKKAAGIALMAGASADLGKLSKRIRKETGDPLLPFALTVLSDRGEEEAAALRSVFSAAIQGALMVAVIGFLFHRRKSVCAGLFCALSVPAVCLVSAAVLSACGLPLNRVVFAGIAAGIGAAVDPIILCSEKLKKCRNYGEADASLKMLYGPLAAGALTTVAALLPIPAMGSVSGHGDAAAIAAAIAAVTLTALVVSLGPLPPLLLWNLRRPAAALLAASAAQPYTAFPVLHRRFLGLLRHIARKANRFLAANIKFCVKHPRAVVMAGLFISAAGLAALCVRGVDSGSYGSGNSVYAHVEFEGGLLAEEVDSLLASYGESLAARYGFVNVETTAKTGSGSVLAAFDPKKINAARARETARQIPIPQAFLFFPETTTKERHWEIKIVGDDSRQCREIAEETARSLSACPLVKDRVLNFKQGSPKIELFPEREKLAALGFSFIAAADTLRRAVHGPVAYKRVWTRGETDVRLRLSGEPEQALSKSQTLGVLLPLQNAGSGYAGGVRLDSLVTAKDGFEPSSIKREDRRRVASVTISTRPMDPRRVKKQIMAFLDSIDLPNGYSIEFDPEAIRQAQALTGTALHFLLALLFCYMVLGAVNESFFVPFAILFAVPPSLAAPAIFLAIAGFPFSTAAACAFIAVSGMTVNAAVLCAGGMETAVEFSRCGKCLSLYRILRQKLPALFATSATTIAGAIPFLFLSEGANLLARTIALVTALGIGGSFLCVISTVPAFMLLFSLERK